MSLMILPALWWVRNEGITTLCFENITLSTSILERVETGERHREWQTGRRRRETTEGVGHVDTSFAVWENILKQRSSVAAAPAGRSATRLCSL